MRRLGIDIGSLYLSCVVLENDEIIAHRYVEHQGKIDFELERILQQQDFQAVDTIGITGNRDSAIDEYLALIEGIKVLLPNHCNVFVVGGQKFSLIFFDEHNNYREHSGNPPCASGTGSFIEQQARRLGISAAELGKRAINYTGKIPAIATRCAVFAKTDIIHAMQEGYSLDAVCAGLCEGIAQSVLDTLVKGRTLVSPVAIVGGVSLNERVVKAIAKKVAMDVQITEYGHVVGAVGAAKLGTAKKLELVLSSKARPRELRPPLTANLTNYPDFSSYHIHKNNGVEVMLPPRTNKPRYLYLGIDIGSTSTKSVFIDEQGQVLAGFYTATAGEPIAAVQKIVQTATQTIDLESTPLYAVATTGSGRKMIRELFRADADIDEITAHAKAAVQLTPNVDTIIEIGGQDAKFTRIRDGEVCYATMNYVCAAGTGSFIEEQAQRLGVDLSKFSDLALGAQAPYTSDRCTVYMERDLSELLGQNWSRESLAAAVLHSIRDNYLAKVVHLSPIGENIVFQGATARNRALVECFQSRLKKSIYVSPYCHLTGVLGAALFCRENELKESTFMGEIDDSKLRKEICTLCANRCELTVVSKNAAWGMKCGKDYADKKVKKSEPSSLVVRFVQGLSPLLKTSQIPSRKATISLPRILYNSEYAYLWHNFLTRLGFKVIDSHPSRYSLAKGKSIVNSDFCAPMVISHGVVAEALQQADYVFIPAIINDHLSQQQSPLFKDKTSDSYFCYYSQYLPTIVNNLTSIETKNRLISPLISFANSSTTEIAASIHQQLQQKFPELTSVEVITALEQSYQIFHDITANRSQTYQRLADPSRLQIAILGRPYVVSDPTMELGLIRKIENLNADVFWQDEFYTKDIKSGYSKRYLDRMHWQYGQRILQVAELCTRIPNLFPVFLSCFRCSPDAFLLTYVKDILDHYAKPYLILQLDEHSSDVGYNTRIEAGLRSFRKHFERTKKNGNSNIAGQAPR